MKRVVAIEPYEKFSTVEFRRQAYEAWGKIGGECRHTMFPPKLLHRILKGGYGIRLPHDKAEARLIFVTSWCLNLLAWPSIIRHEVIPFFWDVWPRTVDMVCRFFARNKVKTAFFTSSEMAAVMQQRFPEMNIYHIPEGIDSSKYDGGYELCDRAIDVLEYGRSTSHIVPLSLPPSVTYVHGNDGQRVFKTDADFHRGLESSKIVIAFPRSVTDPKNTGGVETLTQRYWENMLSRNVMLGQAPRELVGLIGYNPVIDVDKDNPSGQVERILSNISDYQELVDRNRRAALEYGDWTARMKDVMNILIEHGYKIK